MAPSLPAGRGPEILAAVRAAGEEVLRLDPARLRFSMGSSLGDVRVPVQVAADASAIVHGAAKELAMLLVTRHRRFVPPDDLDRAVLADGYDALPSPEPSLGPAGGGPDLRAAGMLGPALHPALTGGVLCAWMGPGGRGRSFTALFIETLGRAFRELAATRGREETPFIALLALGAELSAAEEGVRELLPAPPLDRYLRAATAAGLWVAARTGLARALRAASRPESDPLTGKLEAALGLGPLLSVNGPGLGGAIGYGCELLAALPRAEETVARLAQGGDPDAAAGEVARALAADASLALRAEAAVAVAQLRRVLLPGIAAAESEGRGDTLGFLRDLYTAPGALTGILADDRGREELCAKLSRSGRIGGEAGAALEWASRVLAAVNRRAPAQAVGIDREAARGAYAWAARAYASDLALERLLEPARRALVARTGDEAEGGAEAEWEAGRLYRLSARSGPILKAGSEQPLAHLFADVKDFTRRTALLGRAAMAEFLRTEFYRPILGAAKARFTGMPHLADRGGIAVNNLLGDALSLSGDVEALLALAAEIRALLAACGERLSGELSSQAVARQLAVLEARYGAELGRLEGERAATASSASPARLAWLAEERARVEGERATALARARGEGLEAGVFLSHGPAPVTVLIDDEVFGQSRVAIAEKINESARGTARAAGARVRADAALAAEQAAQGGPPLTHAWSVFVEPPLTLEVPPELERAALASARGGDFTTAMRYLAAPVREALSRAVRAGGDAPGEIYNAGVALSEEALVAFLDAVKEARQLRRLELEPRALPESLRARWFYGTARLELVATFDLQGRPAELFRHAGRAGFKGLGAVPVWELASASGGPGELFRTLGPSWLAPAATSASAS